MTQIPLIQSDKPGRLARRERYLRVAGVLLIALLVGFAGWQGLRLRWWVWNSTTPVRVNSDLDRGFDWGRTASAEGVLNQYEKMQLQKPADKNWLDYGPLRLEIMNLWAKWAAIHHPSVKRWSDQGSYESAALVMRSTLATQVGGVVTAFFLVRLWVRRSGGGSAGFFRGVPPGLVAAAILWFNPATILDGYGWPGGDGWMIPFFLLAALAASLDWWFAAGIVLGVGTMLNGQLMGAVPVFAIWALIGGGGLAAAQRRKADGGAHLASAVLGLGASVALLLGGVAVAVAAVASPWLLSSIPADKLAAARAAQAGHEAWQTPAMSFAIARTLNTGAIIWVTGVAVVVAVLPWLGGWSTAKPHWPDRLRATVEHRWFWPVVAGTTAFAWTIWPWLRATNRHGIWTGLLCAAAATALMLLVRPGRSMVKPAVIAAATALLLCTSVFNASTAWWDCGVKFDTIHRPTLITGTPDNAPAVLVDDYRWSNDNLNYPALKFARHEVLGLWPVGDREYSIGELLRFTSQGGVLLAAMGLGVQARRRDARVLIALATPWIWIYCFTPQTQERDLVFASAVTCLCAGISTGMTLLGIALSVIATLSVLHQMMKTAGYTSSLQFERQFGAEFPSLFNKDGPKLRNLADGSHPELAWAVMLIALIFLYFSLAFRGMIRGWIVRWRRRDRPMPVPNAAESVTVPVETIPGGIISAGITSV